MLVIDPPAPTKTTTKTTVKSDIDLMLERMEERLRKHGWCQHRLIDLNGRRCLVGAASIAWPADGYTSNTWNGVFQRIQRTIGSDLSHCNQQAAVDWNNAEGRTIEEVLTMLQQARTH